MLALTKSHAPPRTRSANFSFPFSGHKTALPLAPETRTAPSSPLAPSSASVYYMPQPTPEKLSQCRVCLGSRAVRLLISEASKDIRIQRRRMDFQSRQAEHQYSHPGVQTAIHLGRAKLRLAFSTQKRSLRQRTPQSVASRLHPRKGTRGRLEATRSPACLSKCLPRTGKHGEDSTSDDSKEYVEDEKGSSDPACFFGKRNFKLSATVD